MKQQTLQKGLLVLVILFLAIGLATTGSALAARGGDKSSSGYGDYTGYDMDERGSGCSDKSAYSGDASSSKSNTSASSMSFTSYFYPPYFAAKVYASPVGGRPLYTSLSGAAEVPDPGDPDGFGTAFLTLNQGQGLICWELSVSEIGSATAAHIHAAEAGVSGPVVVTLSPPSEGSSYGCTEVDAELIMAIRQNPSGYYVNVHNNDYPVGALRGQLGK